MTLLEFLTLTEFFARTIFSVKVMYDCIASVSASTCYPLCSFQTILKRPWTRPAALTQCSSWGAVIFTTISWHFSWTQHPSPSLIDIHYIHNTILHFHIDFTQLDLTELYRHIWWKPFLTYKKQDLPPRNQFKLPLLCTHHYIEALIVLKHPNTTQ